MPKIGAQRLICSVCGDKAIAYNFGIQSCESCKAFFRRNAFRENAFVCKFGGKCEIDVISRRLCRKCRLMKCFAVGMNKAYIFSDEEKSKRKAIVEEKRRKSKVNNELNAIHSSDTSSQTQSDSSLNDTNNVSMIVENDVNTDSVDKSQNILSFDDIETEESYDEGFPIIPIANQMTTYDKNLNQIEMNRLAELLNATQKIRDPVSKVTSEATVYPDVRQWMYDVDSSLNDTNNVSMIVENYVNTDSANNSQNILDLNDMEIEQSFAEQFPMIPIPNQINTYDKNLNDIEMNRLEELLTATKQIWEPISKITSESVDYPDVRYTMDTKLKRDVSRLTLLSKHLSSFTGICDEDRMFLLKAGYREILPMRSLIAYNYDRQHWAIVLDSNNTTVLKVTTLKMFGQDYYDLYKKFFNKYGREWDFDSIILDLLTAIALFTPDRPNIVHKHAVKLQQQMYIHLLRRYLRLKYSESEMNVNSHNSNSNSRRPYRVLLFSEVESLRHSSENSSQRLNASETSRNTKE
ncbi:unnamed protein product [Oppiella nova]|uniref:Nuclear receptor domain-containing protein n=1 Tax=Oppiella nova TaxID=334625 RepID=A0A7R9QBP1_9ACAR|nr:unnamed protein product [Oppiella nova]CAG2162031.1 unnamed protein product [Oppiella nova]